MLNYVTLPFPPPILPDPGPGPGPGLCRPQTKAGDLNKSWKLAGSRTTARPSPVIGSDEALAALAVMAALAEPVCALQGLQPEGVGCTSYVRPVYYQRWTSGKGENRRAWKVCLETFEWML